MSPTALTFPGTLPTTPTDTLSISATGTAPQYWIKIVPYTVIDGETREYPESVKKTATQAGEVSNLHALHSSDEMEIGWDKSDTADSYRVYRSVEDGKYKLVAEINDADKTTFADDDVKEGVLYTYKVCANRTLYNGVNYPSEGRTIQLVCGMSAPTDLIATSEASRVHLSWNYNTYATGYNIYVAHGGSDLEYLDATERNYFITDKLTAGDTYTFRVEPDQHFAAAPLVLREQRAVSRHRRCYRQQRRRVQHPHRPLQHQLTRCQYHPHRPRIFVLRKLLAGLQRRYRNPRRELALVLRRHDLQRQRLSRLRQHAL